MDNHGLIWHTRPYDDSVFFANELAPHGIESIIGSVLHIVRKPVTPPFHATPTALLLTSRHAAHALAEIPAAWRKLPTYCVGSATAHAANRYGMGRVIHGNSDVLSLLPRIAIELGKGSSLLHFSSDDGRVDIKRILAVRGIEVITEIVYFATPEHQLSAEIKAALAAGKISAVTFFSPRTAKITCDLLTSAGLADAARSIAAYCLSGNVGKDAGRLHWANIHICREPSRRVMRELIVSHFQKAV